MLRFAMRDITHPAERLVQAMARIYQYRMTTTSGGNLSIRDEDGSIWITPARVDKGALRVEDIVRVLPDGSTEGRHKPSSEFPFHLQDLSATPGSQSHRARPPGGAGGLQHLRPIAGHPALLPRRARSAARSDSRPTRCPAATLLGERIAEVFAAGP